MTTPEINSLIKPLEQYMTPDQKAELEKILSIGKKLKEQGQKLKEKYRSQNYKKYYKGENYMYEEEEGFGESSHDYTADTFIILLYNYQKNKSKWIEENKKILEDVGYYMMSPIEKKKFEEDFILDLILYKDTYLYTDFTEINLIKHINTLKELKETGLGIGFKLEFHKKNIGENGFKEIIEVIEKKGGLNLGFRFNIGYNGIGDDGIIRFAKMLEKTGGIKAGTKLYFFNNEIGSIGIISLAQALEKTGGLKNGVDLNFNDNDVGDEGIIALANMIENTDGMREGVELKFHNNDIGDKGIQQLIQSIKKTGGLKEGTKLFFGSNNFGEYSKTMFRELAHGLNNCEIDLDA